MDHRFARKEWLSTVHFPGRRIAYFVRWKLKDVFSANLRTDRWIREHIDECASSNTSRRVGD